MSNKPVITERLEYDYRLNQLMDTPTDSDEFKHEVMTLIKLQSLFIFQDGCKAAYEKLIGNLKQD